MCHDTSDECRTGAEYSAAGSEVTVQFVGEDVTCFI